MPVASEDAVSASRSHWSGLHEIVTPANSGQRRKIGESSANFSTTDHGIRPGLEVAMAFRPVRPIRILRFGQVRAIWLISGTATSFTDSNRFC